MNIINQRPIDLIIFVFCLAATAVSSGKTVSVSFAGEGMTSVMDKTEVAGVLWARTDHWNVVACSTELIQNRLLFNDGTVSPVNMIRSSGNWLSNREKNPQSGDDKMFCGVLDVPSSVSITFTGVPFELYDVFVYRRSDQADRAGSFSIGNQTYYMRDTSASHPKSEAGYILSADTSYSGNRYALIEEIEVGNYVQFTDMSGSEFTLAVQALSGADDAHPRSKVSGIQIVEVSRLLGLLIN